MKTIFFCIMMGIASSAFAQIRSVSVQASGLTCSMCSRAIYKALKELPDVSDVQEDIEHSSYHVRFNSPDRVSLFNLKKAIKDAGFSVASMEVNADFQHTEVASDSVIRLNDLTFHFVDIHRQTLNGDTRLLIVDRDYLQEKVRKKLTGSFNAEPATDHTAATFHVTLPQS